MRHDSEMSRERYVPSPRTEGRPDEPRRQRRGPRRRPMRRFPPTGPGYTGPGEAGRYGHAPVPYGPEHTYDYHLGDRYGRGPDFWTGEARVRRGPAPRPPRPPRPRRRPYRRVRRRE